MFIVPYKVDQGYSYFILKIFPPNVMYGYMNIFIKQDQNSIQLCLVLKIEYLLFQHFIFQI